MNYSRCSSSDLGKYIVYLSCILLCAYLDNSRNRKSLSARQISFVSVKYAISRLLYFKVIIFDSLISASFTSRALSNFPSLVLDWRLLPHPRSASLRSCCDRLIEGAMIRDTHTYIHRRSRRSLLARCQKRKFCGHGAPPRKFSRRESYRNIQTFRMPLSVVNFENFVTARARVSPQLCIAGLMATGTNGTYVCGNTIENYYDVS